MDNDKKCVTCNHSGMDMDMDPYCAHPEILKISKYGISLSSKSAPTRPGGLCHEHKLWEIRSNQNA